MSGLWRRRYETHSLLSVFRYKRERFEPHGERKSIGALSWLLTLRGWMKVYAAKDLEKSVSFFDNEKLHVPI